MTREQIRWQDERDPEKGWNVVRGAWLRSGRDLLLGRQSSLSFSRLPRARRGFGSGGHSGRKVVGLMSVSLTRIKRG